MSLFLITQQKSTQFLKRLARSPGVYIFRDVEKKVLYVGRATSLRSRVASYFSGRDSRGERIFQMVDRARSIETVETETVLESVILEANLIKKYQPKYNVDLKDDKSFSYFAVTKEEFPRIFLIREKELQKNDSVYSRTYGPYTNKRHMEIVLKILRRIFPFHSGSQKTEKGCLYRQIGICPGPYDGGITKELYRKNIRNIEYVLRGQKRRLLSTLEKEMQRSSKGEDFERANKLKDQVFALRHIRDIALLTNDQRQITNNDNFILREGSKLGVESCKSIRIEAYDISNISGDYGVASMVVFENGEPAKQEYRKFKIQSVKGVNDVAMMREVLARRIRHTEWKTPDMIVLDGGQGHLNMAVSLWKALDVRIPLVGVAKGPTRKKVDIYTDLKFLPDPTLLNDKLFLERIREEAHRFAITYHRKVRGKNFLRKDPERKGRLL